MNSNCIQTLKKMAAALLLALVLLTSTQLPARADDMAAENIIRSHHEHPGEHLQRQRQPQMDGHGAICERRRSHHGASALRF